MNIGRKKAPLKPKSLLGIMSVYNNHETLLLCHLFSEVNKLILKSDWTNAAGERIYGNYNQVNNIKGHFLPTLAIFTTLGI